MNAAAFIRQKALWLYAAVFYFFLYGPIFALLVLSFNDSIMIGLPLRGFTLKWYDFVLHSPELMRALLNSFLLGFVSSAIATALALLMAMGFRREFPLKSLLMKIILLPILIPGIVSGVIFLTFFGFAQIPFGLWTTALIVHVTWVLPFAFLTIYPRLHGFDSSLEEAAMDLGARPWMVFQRVVFPIIRPGVVATLMFGFTLSFDEFIRTFLVIKSQRTIPVHLWTLLVGEMAPFLPAVGVVIMVVSICVSALGFVASAQARRTSAS